MRTPLLALLAAPAVAFASPDVPAPTKVEVRHVVVLDVAGMS